MTEPPTVVRGLRVRMVSMPSAHTVGACLSVAAGSADDPGRPWGTAHLTEHARIAAAGSEGVHTAGRTENTESRFTVVGLAEQAESIVGSLARKLHPGYTVDTSVLNAERHAVAIESRAVAANPLLLLGPAAAEAAVPDGRLADTARATAESLSRITRQHVEEFTAQHYRPRNAVLTVAGPLPEHRRLLDTIAAALPPEDDWTDSPDVPAERPRLDLPSELDGLLVLTAVSERTPWGRSIVRGLTSAAGPFVAGAAAARHGLVGRATVTAGNHEVVVLCWRDDRRSGTRANSLRSALAGAFTAGARVDDVVTGAWRDTVLHDYQEYAFARASPLGRSQCELLPAPLKPAEQPLILSDGLRRAAELCRLWRVHAGTLQPDGRTESEEYR